MNEYDVEVDCPNCGRTVFALEKFDHIIVMARGVAMATYMCPRCHSSLTTPIALSPTLAQTVDARIHDLTFEHPQSNLERFCISEELRNEEHYAEMFNDQMASVDSVDDLLDLIQSAYEQAES